MVAQRQRLEVFEEAVPEAVDEALAGLDLNLRAVGRHDLVGELQQDAHHDEREREVVASDRPRHIEPELGVAPRPGRAVIRGRLVVLGT